MGQMNRNAAHLEERSDTSSAGQAPNLGDKCKGLQLRGRHREADTAVRTRRTHLNAVRTPTVNCELRATHTVDLSSLFALARLKLGRAAHR